MQKKICSFDHIKNIMQNWWEKFIILILYFTILNLCCFKYSFISRFANSKQNKFTKQSCQLHIDNRPPRPRHDNVRTHRRYNNNNTKINIWMPIVWVETYDIILLLLLLLWAIFLVLSKFCKSITRGKYVYNYWFKE